MAVLFATDSDGNLELLALNDDAELGSRNPRLENTLSEGEYLLRVLPFADEEMESIEVHISQSSIGAEQM